ncbi:SRPBCC domain-containing protein [Asticcacaulis sp. BYS171W]|uniref:SRPBCC domain-containing protein n=1 Tax=Asticcacaulis aquaticus TaxID=2984212 RepID=A0ABT5HS18_9CAUL|nr:SRPBCC domain-containing protein [Asticcacaulis aquaticus]MDC7682625.1 SRPBCC domain-containing protein [Asticcacaulis aquaticus]
MKLATRPSDPMSGFEVSFPSEIDIVMFRTFKAPPALVFKLWTAPEHVMQWWGPNGFENLNCEMDFRVGGRFRIDMRAPDGTLCPCEGTYVEIVESERIVYEGDPHIDHPCGSGLPPEALVTITFKPDGDGTRLTLHSKMISPDITKAAIEMGFSTGWADSFDRLEAAMDTLDQDRFEIVTSRRFAATPAELFGLFADPAHLARWWGPDGFTNSIPVFDFREGGAFHITMHGPDGRDHENHKGFVEIVENERIVFDHYQPTHEFRMTIEYIGDGDHTDMIWRMDFAPSEHEAMLKAFIPQANEQNYDKLDDYILKTRGY